MRPEFSFISCPSILHAGRLLLLSCTLLILPPPGFADDRSIVIDRAAYQDRLQGFWLGSSIGNWTGLPTENVKARPPFFTDSDWQTRIGRDGERVDYVLTNDPWHADDDTDIEYVYQHALERSASYLLSPGEIAREWQAHIGLPLLWVSNLAALGQMQNGARPPATSLPENNPMWEMIDAQLTTEIFGALAPARPDVALRMAQLPIRTTAYLHSEWAAEFYVIMHALVARVDPALPPAAQLAWMAERARKRVPDWSYIADMYDFVKQQYESGEEHGWERTRDRVYARYQLQGAAAYEYKYPWDSGINFAASLVSLFYGEGDFRETIRIGTLAGWDSDNPTATWGGLLGLLYGHAGLQAYFNRDFSDAYRISRTRYGFADTPDSFHAMAARALKIIDRVVTDGMDGAIVGNAWVIPPMPQPITPAVASETRVPWRTIEDSDPRWEYAGFSTQAQRWNASGATLTVGHADCRAEIRLTATAVQYYAYRNADAGTVLVTLNDEPPVRVDLSTRGVSLDPANLGSEAGDSAPADEQYYVKVFERSGLPRSEHRLLIDCDSSERGKSIDMLSIIP